LWQQTADQECLANTAWPMKKKRLPFLQTLFQSLQFFLTVENEVIHVSEDNPEG
jgi:hypothetical protein